MDLFFFDINFDFAHFFIDYFYTMILKIMQLNLALESVESLNIGMTYDEKLMLHAEINFSLSYKQLKDLVEAFANHLDRISSMFKSLNQQE